MNNFKFWRIFNYASALAQQSHLENNIEKAFGCNANNETAVFDEHDDIVQRE